MIDLHFFPHSGGFDGKVDVNRTHMVLRENPHLKEETVSRYVNDINIESLAYLGDQGFITLARIIGELLKIEYAVQSLESTYDHLSPEVDTEEFLHHAIAELRAEVLIKAVRDVNEPLLTEHQLIIFIETAAGAHGKIPAFVRETQEEITDAVGCQHGMDHQEAFEQLKLARERYKDTITRRKQIVVDELWYEIARKKDEIERTTGTVIKVEKQVEFVDKYMLKLYQQKKGLFPFSHEDLVDFLEKNDTPAKLRSLFMKILGTHILADPDFNFELH